MADLLTSLSDYQVSPTHGFLPEDPLHVLPGDHFTAWEELATNLPSLTRNGELDALVEALPVLSTTHLRSEAEWHRAYVLLGYITNGYLYAIVPAKDTIPLQLSQPMLAVASHVGLPPLPTYAGQGLWNYTRIDPSNPSMHPSNVTTMVSFTGDPNESCFFGTSVAIEACGAPIIPALLSGFEAVRRDDVEGVITSLRTAERKLGDMTTALAYMHKGCTPDFFYNTLRRYLEGSRETASIGLPNGVFYEEKDPVTGKIGGRFRQYRGASNAQSSIFAFIDLALGVKHPSTSPLGKRDPLMNFDVDGLVEPDFLQEMRWYMPRPHRAFLYDVGHAANIRQYVDEQDSADLHVAYRDCINALAAFRGKHIQMVTRYVILQTRKKHKEQLENAKEKAAKETEVKQSSTPTNDTGESRGTGGTKPIEFLKAIRDRILGNALW